MSSLRKTALGNSIRLGDPDFAIEVACQNEKKDWIARKIGLPGIGSKLVNQHGIQWVVQNHAEAPTIDTLQRWRNQEIDPQADLYPVVTPLNFSPRLVEFFHAIDRCTTKKFAILDTMPGRRKDGHVPGGNSIDTVCHPVTNLLFLDAARVHETVIAHEFGHAWVQYVDECEDFRTMEDASDSQRMRQVSYVQSFVLDLKVNDLLRRKGFDMEPIEGDQARSMLQLAVALDSGYRPEHPREEVFMALLVADQMVQRETGRSNELVRVNDCLAKIRGTYAPLARLAETMANSVSRNGYETYDSIIRCIDECLLASFDHIGETLDLDSELTLVNPDEPDLDKFPIWLTQIPPKLKCKVGRHMALNDISSAWPHHVEQSLTGKAKVIFDSPQRDRRSHVVVDHRFGPPTRYFECSENEAEVLELKRTNEEALQRQLRAMDPQSHLPKHIRDHDELVKRLSGTSPSSGPLAWPNLPGRPYMAGVGCFLTAARLKEQFQGEAPYTYALSNPVSYIDPDGLQPHRPGGSGSGMGTNFGPCTVSICNEKTLPFGVGWIPSHMYVCVTGKHGGCSGGIYPTGGPVSPGTIGNLGDPCNTRSDPYRVECTVVATGCDIASKVCDCVKKSTKSPGTYVFPVRSCYTYPNEMIKCACESMAGLGLSHGICVDLLIPIAVA